MLIYVNQFNLVGTVDEDIIFRTIAGWLKSVTNKHFTIDELKTSTNYSIDRARVRTFSALDYSPKLYSVLLSHPDRVHHGRQWITEIGIKKENDCLSISILLEVSDISTQVKEFPTTTRPTLVRFLNENTKFSPDTIGLNVKTLNNTVDDFKSLNISIERPERSYPLVLVSNKNETNEPFVNPEKLQEQLIGLAQVVYVSKDINSWSMEDSLGRKYSAWDGAINIIFPASGNYNCRTKLLLSEQLNDLVASKVNISHEVLSLITHSTNGFRKRHHFSPRDVRAKRQKDQRIKLKSQFDEISENTEYQFLAEEAFKQLEEQENLFDQEKELMQSKSDDYEMRILETDELLDQEKNNNRLLKLRINEILNSSGQSGSPLLITGNETDNYNGEIHDFVVDSLKKELDNSKEYSRKFDVLTDIILSNPLKGTREEYIEEIESLFSNYDGLTGKITSNLKRLGLEVIDTGNHNKLKFESDERYKMTFSKSPSDKKRVGANIIQQVKQELF